jgi:ribosomal protein L21
VQPEQTLDIDRLAADAGAMVEFREVLLVGNDGDVQVGAPFVEGARVVAEVLEQGRDKKLLVFKYKNKVRYRRRHGHRQAFTRLAIRQILTEGGVASAEEKPARPSRKRAAPKAKTEPEGEVELAAQVPQPESVEAPTAEPATTPEAAAEQLKHPARPRKRPEGETQASVTETTAGARPQRTARSRKATSGETEQSESDRAPGRAEGEAKPARRTRTSKTQTEE